MKKALLCCLIAVVLCINNLSNITAADELAVEVTVSSNTRYQTIEGFGFFGARNVWWESASYFYDEEWANMIIDDMGITMWRNEIQPNNPVTSNIATPRQGTHWAAQKDMITKLYNKAKEKGTDLKVILTVWSPPAEFKVKVNDYSGVTGITATRGDAHNTTVDGGTLNPLSYTDYANWLVAALDMYKEIGIDVYALSLQNEPAFVEPYNSCIYTAEWYNDMLKNCIPIIKAKYPNVKIFGSEHMLGSEASRNSFERNFHYSIVNDKDALNNLDVFAYHGYSDGVQSEAIANHANLWNNAYLKFAAPNKKDSWMTETSGYSNNWLSDGTTPGAFDLGIAIQSALKYGKASAWVWWQGSERTNNDKTVYALMNGTSIGKRYTVSKQFYKFIRPGAVMLDTSCTDERLISTSFYNDSDRTFTSVLVNSSDVPMKVTIKGDIAPADYKYYITTDDPNVNANETSEVLNGAITVPPTSIVTLVKDNNSVVLGDNVECTGVTIAAKKKTLKYGKTFNLNAAVLPENCTNKRLIYSVDNPNIASVTKNGKIKALSSGKTHVIAMTEYGSVAAKCQVTVITPVKSVKFKKAAVSLKAKSKRKLKYSLKPYDADKPKISFKTEAGNIAKVNAKGMVTAIKKGTAIIKITVKSSDGSKKTAKCRVRVK